MWKSTSIDCFPNGRDCRIVEAVGVAYAAESVTATLFRVQLTKAFLADGEETPSNRRRAFDLLEALGRTRAQMHRRQRRCDLVRNLEMAPVAFVEAHQNSRGDELARFRTAQ